MAEHYYTIAERRDQLARLERALRELLPIARELEMPQVPDYERAFAKAQALQTSAFTQEELTALARSVPDGIDRHRDWESKYLQQQPDGTWRLPNWLVELDAKLLPALAAADELRFIGRS